MTTKPFKCRERVEVRSGRRRGWPVEYTRCSRNAQDGSLYCKQHTEMSVKRIAQRDRILARQAERAARKAAPVCTCMTEPDENGVERVVTHSSDCPEYLGY